MKNWLEMNQRELGKWGEGKAKEYLMGKGYRILQENYKCKAGEIDLIGSHGGYLVFIEVKTRRSTSYGLPVEAVDHRKQQKYIKTALNYIKEKRMLNTNYRFDIVEVRIGRDGSTSINHIVNAFQAVNSGYYL